MGSEGYATERITHFILETGTDRIPPEVTEQAQRAMMDFVGVALAGSREPLCDILLDYAESMGGALQCSVIGRQFKSSAFHAALINGATGHALDYDDWSMAVWAHPSAFLVPSILALGELIGAPGKDLLTAYVVGFEVAACIPWAVKRDHYDRGWHTTGTIGSLGAAAACSWLLKLNASQVRKALGIAASLSGGIRANNGTMTKPLHAGMAAANGVAAALLAQRGFTAVDNIMDVARGFVWAFGYGGQVDWAEALAELGVRFALTSPEGIIMKPYPCCGGCHFGIDAALDLKENNQFDIEEIEEIELGVNPLAELPLIHHDPKTGLEAKFSLEYTVARALVSGQVGVDDFTDQAVWDPTVRRLMSKMKWVVRYPMPQKGTSTEFDPKSVLIKLRDGRTLFKEVLIHKGMPQNPLTLPELERKYRACASKVLSDSEVEASLSLLKNIRGLREVRELMALISPTE